MVAKVLVVGAGGIGCELLKTIVLAGVSDIEIIDLDTIDVSNLNRQFLFRREHVGKSKAHMAKEAVMKVRPDIQIKAHHGSVFEKKFGTKWLKTFNVVINALDNLKARRHMNRLCLAADVPLVDGGTGGYQGQVTVHIKGKTQCYECEEKPTPKTYPVCTIRSTPDKIEHCVAWSKYFFEILFGKDDDTNMLADMTQDQEDQEEQADEAVAQESIRWRDGEDAAAYSWRVFHRAFQTDIETQAKMFEEADKKRPPVPLTAVSEADATACPEFKLGVKRSAQEAQKVQPVDECCARFFSCIQSMVTNRSSEFGGVSFDKDDELAMEFVVAATNLRAHVFSIEKQSQFKIKSIAGAIIPAIATTNAIVAGLIVLEVLKLIASQQDKCQAIYVTTSQSHPLTATPMPKPNPDCFVCRARPPVIECWIDTNVTTLGEFVTKVLKDKLGFLEPSIDVNNQGNELCLFEDEEESEENLPKIMKDFYMSDETLLKIEDMTQDQKAEVNILHRDEKDFDKEVDPGMFHVSIVPVQGAEGAGAEADGKRKRTDDAEEEPESKRQDLKDDDDLVCL